MERAREKASLGGKEEIELSDDLLLLRLVSGAALARRSLLSLRARRATRLSPHMKE